jgi:hypothetical protein
MEGVGIPPDYYVETRVEDYLNNVDGVLKYAVKLIRDKEI